VHISHLIGTGKIIENYLDYQLFHENIIISQLRYNLKRKVSELPPVTAEDFQNRVIQARKDDEDASQDQSLYCKACKKFFKTKNAHDNHLGSKKHKDNLKFFLQNQVNEDENSAEIQVSVPTSVILEERKQFIEEDEDAMEVESVNSDEWDDDTMNPIANNDCIFCDHHSKNLVKNLKHMSIAHSFFIPDAEYCSDVEGLLSYLAEKVCADFICLWCNEKGRTFYSLQAVRQHMIEKGHTKMLHEGSALAEYVDYYDYSSSYADHDDSKDIDAEIEPTKLDGNEFELVLPSGNVIGHRSLMKYYKQRFDPLRSALVLSKSEKKLHHVLSQYRSLGWTQGTPEESARKARDIHAMKRAQQKMYMKLGMKANKFQPHYRPQVNF
jgi:pre-60S factor REI1